MTGTTRFERNHIRLSGFHIGLAAIWAIVFSAAVLFDRSSLTGPGRIAVPLIGLLFVLFHMALAWGATVKSEIARKISVAVGVVMFMWLPGMRNLEAPYFPYLAFIALFMLPLTQWKASPALPAVPQSSAAN